MRKLFINVSSLVVIFFVSMCVINPALAFSADKGFRFDLNIGWIPWYFGDNQNMKDSWSKAVPCASKDDTFDFLQIALDTTMSIKVNERVAVGIYYGWWGPTMSTTITYTSYGYWYYYYGVWYYVPPGTYDETWQLNMAATHIGPIIRYYFCSGAEADVYIECCGGRTKLSGGFWKESSKLTEFTGAGPYSHIAIGLNAKNEVLPGFCSVKVRVPFGKVFEIKNKEGILVKNSDGSNFTVDYSNLQFTWGIGFGF